MRMKDRIITSRSSSRSITQDVAVCGLFTALIAVGAFIKIVIPVGADTMNFTLQWLFVLLAGLLLGSKRAFRSVAVYLITGLIGFPIFARGGGPAYLLRPTFGFLLGFALAAWAIGFLCEKLRPAKSITWFFTTLAGFVLYYGMGILYFYLILTSAGISDAGGNLRDFWRLLSADHAAGPDALCAGGHAGGTFTACSFSSAQSLNKAGGVWEYLTENHTCLQIYVFQ